MTTNKDLLMQPLSDEELAGVSGGVTGNPLTKARMSVCANQCKDVSPAFKKAECMRNCLGSK